MTIRAVLTTFAFVGSLIATAIGAGWLSIAVEAFSPLDANLYGSYIPAFTNAVMDSAPQYPAYMALVGLLTSAMAVYFWCSSRPVETKTFAISLLATINMFVAGQFPLVFLIGYFVLPRAVALAV